MKLPDDFYDRLESEIAHYGDFLSSTEHIDSEEYTDNDADFDFSFGDYDYWCSISLSITYYSEYIDESFDHEFGTWQDPEPHYKPENAVVECIYDCKFYDENDNEIEFEDFNFKKLNDMNFNC